MFAFIALAAIVIVLAGLAHAHDTASDSLIVTHPGLMGVAAAR